MGVLGASSTIKNDPSRFCENFTLNWDNDDDEPDKMGEQKVALLIDSMSLLHHIVYCKTRQDYQDLGTIRRKCAAYIRKLLDVIVAVGQGESSIRFFFDGLNPQSKTITQVKRLSRQGLIASEMAKGHNIPYKDKILPHFAQSAFQEAIEELMKNSNFNNHLFIYRPRYGEAEAHINDWIKDNHAGFTKLAIISEDSDFLIYDSSPGFIPPNSIKFEMSSSGGNNDKAKPRLQGQLYSRSKFLKALLPDIKREIIDDYPGILTAVAAIAGCDYTAKWTTLELQHMNKLRGHIVRSDIGGLRLKYRKNPTASQAFTAIVRFINHYAKNHGPHIRDDDAWIFKLIKDNCAHSARQIVYDMIDSVYETYYEDLEVAYAFDDLDCCLVDVRRLLSHGIVYCYPVVETDSVVKTVDIHDMVSSSSATLPPTPVQIEAWINHGYSVWMYPHFCQLRRRLYALIRQIVKEHNESKIPNRSSLSSIWSRDGSSSEEATDDIKVVEYVRGTQKGHDQQMVAINIRVPQHHSDSTLSSGLEHLQAVMLPSGDGFSLKRCLALTLFGWASKHVSIFEHEQASSHIVSLISSMMLPDKLAALVLLLETAPSRMVDTFGIPVLTNKVIQKEVDLFIPLIDVAIHHGMLLYGTLSLLLIPRHIGITGKQTIEEKSKECIGGQLSDIFDYASMLIIWEHLRCANNNIGQHVILDVVFTGLQSFLKPTDDGGVAWKDTLEAWKHEATSVWNLWCQVGTASS